MRLAWLTDLHLDFVTDEYRRMRLFDEVLSTAADAVLVGGDTGEADSFASKLDELAAALQTPVYFVLGNHDYYRGSISQVRDLAKDLSRHCDDIQWLPDAHVVDLSERTALIGHGGWGDGRAGDFMASTVILNDYLMIRELQESHGFPEREQILTSGLLEKLNALGDEAAAHLEAAASEALRTHDEVLVLMHVPPFHDACWHQGQLSDANWSPHFVCQAAGEALRELMRQRPEKRMTVLCGHTHSGGEASILANLQVLTGAAEYGEPEVQRVLTVK